MKTKFPAFLFLFVTVFITQSCQKEISFDPGTIINNPSGIIDSNYLSKMYGIYITGPVVDTGEVYSYNYDNQKRVISLTGISKDLYNYTQTSFNYYYNSTDTLPYRSRSVYITANDPAQTVLRFDTIITWHFFDNLGRNLRDSMIHATGDASSPTPYYSTLEVRNYSYGTGKIYCYRHFTGINVPNPSYVSPDQKDTATLDVSGNIIDNKSYRYSFFSGQFELEITSTFTYDTKQSPFSRLSNFKTFGVFPNGETFYIELPQYNNRLTQNEHHSFSGGGSGVFYNYTYSNTYKTNGLIKETSIYDQPPVPSSYGKITFEYIHL